MNDNNFKGISDVFRDIQPILAMQKPMMNIYDLNKLKTIHIVKESTDADKMNKPLIHNSIKFTYKIKPHFPELKAQVPLLNFDVNNSKLLQQSSLKSSIKAMNNFNFSFMHSTFDSLKQSLKISVDFSSLVPSMNILSQFDDITLQKITVNKHLFEEMNTIKRIMGNAYPTISVPTIPLSFENVFDFSNTDLTEEEQATIIKNSNDFVQTFKDVAMLATTAPFGVTAVIPATKRFVSSVFMSMQEIVFNEFLINWFQSKMQHLIDTATHEGMSSGFTCIIIGILLVYYRFSNPDELDELEYYDNDE